MKLEQVKTTDDIEMYIEGCINDFAERLSQKDETIITLCKLTAHVARLLENLPPF